MRTLKSNLQPVAVYLWSIGLFSKTRTERGRRWLNLLLGSPSGDAFYS